MNSPSPATFVTEIDVKIADKLLEDLTKKGFEISTPPYTIFSAKKKGVSCTLYKSGKLTVQGKEMSEFLEFYLEPEILGQFSFTYHDLNLDKSARIGIDESGKGDFFGPLCIAGIYAEGDAIAKLGSLGVRDSKTLSDKTIRKIAEKLRGEFIHHIVKINPLKYNELYQQFKNLNYLLAWGHATTIEQLVQRSGCQKVIIDQFADESVVLRALKKKNLSLSLSQRHRAEEDPVVAAASILARDTFLEGLEKLSEEFEIKFPKGASALTLEVGKKFLQKYGKEAFANVCKLHFKTFNVILEKNSPI